MSIENDKKINMNDIIECEDCKRRGTRYWFKLGENGESSRKCKICSGCEFRRCNRCPWDDLTTEDFDKNKRTGDYLKTCKKCMTYLRAYSKEKYRNNKEEIIAQFEELKIKNRDKLMSVFECECGSKVIYRSKGGHFRTKKHQEYLLTKA